MRITVLFFAYLKEHVPGGKISLDLPAGATVDTLTKRLEAQYPALQPLLKASIKSVNHEFAGADSVVPEGAEVAYFPPVSGGAGDAALIRLTPQPLSADEVLRQLSGEKIGAVCVFSGMVREKTAGEELSPVRELVYEAYESMALEKMAQIAAEIRACWPDVQQIALIQRIGRVPAGETSTLVACSSAHRDGGIFPAAQYGIERMKQIVPVWKKEITIDDGQHWVTGEYHPLPGE